MTTERAEHPCAASRARRRACVVDGSDAGWIGELHPRLVRRFELPKAPVAFELDLAAVDASGRCLPAGRSPDSRSSGATSPSSWTRPCRRRRCSTRSRAKRPPHVESIAIFDVYRGTGLTAGRKSLAILVLMQDTSRTLTDADIDATVADIVSLLAQRFGATLRT